jgi:O-antigen/teichoic acid export membrane protein
MAKVQQRSRRGSPGAITRPQGLRGGGLADFRGMMRDATGHALGLMTMRSVTIGAKFVLTLFIARYLGLPPLGAYGLIVSAAALMPVLLGLGVANNLGREAARSGPETITVRMLGYFAFLVPAYAALAGLGAVVLPRETPWLCLLAALLFLEHIQSDLFGLMAINGVVYGANFMLFIRSAGWVLVYIPLALLEPGLRSLKAMGLFWLAGDVLATILALALTTSWRWAAALRALPRTPLGLPHRHGSAALYLNDVANTGFQYVDRYIIGLMLGPELLGVYTLFWSVANAVSSLLTTAIVQPRRGALVQAARASAEAFNRSLRSATVIGVQLTVAVSAAALILMRVAVPFIGRPGLMHYFPVLFILSGAVVFRTVYEIIGISFYAYNRDDITLYSGVTIFVVALVLNVLTVPTFGIWGASFVLAASYVVGVLTRAFIISRGFRSRAPVANSLPEKL